MFPRRGAIAIALTTIALVVLINVKTPDQPVGDANGSTSGSTAIVGTTGAGDTTGATGTTGTTGAGGSTGSSGGSSSATPAPTAQADTSGKTVTGPEVDTRYGPVQVEVTVSGGKVTDVVAVQLPSGGHSGRISNNVAPILRQEALQAQSANIDTVSGATYTSEAYAQSLQAALDSAGL
jgi:uncharacterized protein with FMN-binding domain